MLGLSQGDDLPAKFVVGRKVSASDCFRDQAGRCCYAPSPFFDDRVHSDLSVDVLGRSGSIEKKIFEYLRNIIAIGTAGKGPNGWASIVRDRLKLPGLELAVRYAPVVAEENVPANPYHSEISRDGWRSTTQAWALACALADLYSRKGSFKGLQ